MDTNGRVGRATQRIATSRAFARVGPKVVPRLDRLVSRISRGRWVFSAGLLPIMILHTVGARSGEPRETPLGTVPLDGAYYVVGSNFGRASHPAWSFNLLARPEATVVLKGERIPVVAHLLDEGEKAAMWPRLTAIWASFDRYEDRSGRDLRVFRLEPVVV